MDTDEVVSSQSIQAAIETEPVVGDQPKVETKPIPTSSTPADATRSNPLAQLSSIPPPQLAIDSEPLPRVLVGSEPWHASVPSSWVPMITRDIGRQRRTVSVAAFKNFFLIYL